MNIQTPRLSIIAAIAAKDRAIGFQNQLLWHLPEDLQHFKRVTLGHPIIMGENTFLSIGRALPGRLNIVLTYDKKKIFPGATAVHNVEEALQQAKETEDTEVFVIGGAQVYKTFLPLADRLYLTLVPGEYEADTFFPEYREFQKVIEQSACQTALGEITFLTLEKN